ncbi:hypothetical protein [Paenibacillus sp. 7523-1]|uniref:hypothetical protein n=1 Tax=Paenibacillus sp. 7523-1 TaxID=2022550 RepID=UPI000BA53586|nr:hypothetical protein [Paenibacillus sp. 7523-1]PAD33567.1 hypothetical protein CHH60_00070 [Paenibacillus sp. 7523-1]
MKWNTITYLALGIIVTLALAAYSSAPDERSEIQTLENMQKRQEIQMESYPAAESEALSQGARTNKKSSEPQEGQSLSVTEVSTSIIKALQEKDMETVASWASADGVRFSPFANIDPVHDLVFTPDEISNLMRDPTRYVWRTVPDMDHDKIKMNYADYHLQYVYNKDFIHDGENAVNVILGQDAHPGNLHEIYPEANHDFVEFHVKGSDAQGRDWHTLRLVFEKIGQDHILVGIVHDQGIL